MGLTIACDVDGVVADLHSEWLRWYNSDYQDTLTSEQVTDWEICKFVKPECGKGIYKYLDVPFLYDYVKPVEGALNGVNTLRQWGYRVVFVTSTNMKMSGRKLQWLSDNGFLELRHGTQSPDYIEAVDKSLVKADVMIDDYHANLDNFDGVKILFNQPHNGAVRNNGYYRTSGWEEALGLAGGVIPIRVSHRGMNFNQEEMVKV